MALIFPPSPTPGERVPVDPGTSGVSQYEWNDTKGVWNTVPTSISLGSANQTAYNAYQWPATDGTAGLQLTTDGSGNLMWDIAAAASLETLSVLEPFNGVQKAFTLVLTGTSTFFSPSPSTNIVVFLGGVPQIPTASYTVATNTITFTEAPLAGSTFYAISSTVA
jgi:hypothetical protein